MATIRSTASINTAPTQVKPNRFFKCANCQILMDLDKLTERAIGYHCAKCVESAVACSQCEKPVTAIESNKLGDKVICRVCLDEGYDNCRVCNMFFENGSLIEETNDDGDSHVYCNPCHSAREADGVIHDYNYTPRLAFRGEPWETNQYLGIELEINTMCAPAEHAQEFKRFLHSLGVDKHFFFKRDGSINGGYEIVTHPTTMVHNHKTIPWKEILGWLRKNGARSYESGECGLHVHISKDGINNLEMGKLKMFFHKAAAPITKFSKRKSMSYCRIEDFGLVELTHFLRGEFMQDGRRVAINTETNKGTIEFRLFRGTLNYKRFMASLQMVYASVEFVKEHGSVAIAHQDAWKMFCNWLRKKERYQMLIGYLKSQKLFVDTVLKKKGGRV